MKRGAKSVVWLTCFALLLMLSATAVAAEKSVTMMAVWGGAELEAFQKVLLPFEKATGITVEYTGTRDLPTVLTTRVQAGNPPDIAVLPNPGMVAEFSARDVLVDLGSVLDMETLKKDYAEVWIDLGTYDEKLQVIFISADLKSLVWYNPQVFAAKGYAPSQNWSELIALSEQIVADGGKPWAVGLESGAASGWPGTDWIEDIMLRTAGPELYDQWVNHDIPWTHPAVREAFEVFGSIVCRESYLYGGTTGVLATNFGDSVNALFMDPPGAYLHRQATFIQGFMAQNAPDAVAGTDYDFFALPPIDPKFGTPALGAADMVGMFNDTAEARELIRYLASPEAQEIWVHELGKLSANRRVDPAAYSNDLTRKAAEILVNAEVFRFDGSDLMPPAVGAGSFWKGVLDYVNGTDLDEVLEIIEATADDAYDTGKATN